jgi:hypothetical protein
LRNSRWLVFLKGPLLRNGAHSGSGPDLSLALRQVPRARGSISVPPREKRLIDASNCEQSPESLLADLACARAKLLGIHVRAIKQLIAAKSALGIASVAGLGPSVVCFKDEDGTQLTISELFDLAKELAASEDQVRKLIAQVDAQSTGILQTISGRRH